MYPCSNQFLIIIFFKDLFLSLIENFRILYFTRKFFTLIFRHFIFFQFQLINLFVLQVLFKILETYGIFMSSRWTIVFCGSYMTSKTQDILACYNHFVILVSCKCVHPIFWLCNIWIVPAKHREEIRFSSESWILNRGHWLQDDEPWYKLEYLRTGGSTIKGVNE